jgi:3-oxoacyl-ACP reductase-like protein
MKYFLSAVMAAGWLCLAVAAFAQSTSTPQATPAPAPSAEAAPAAAANPSTAATGGGKRAECLVAAQGKKGQDRQDEMQLCMAQGHVDCLKQAIDQKVLGPQRKDFIKNCMREE